jgi:hypothetical protein
MERTRFERLMDRLGHSMSLQEAKERFRQPRSSLSYFWPKIPNLMKPYERNALRERGSDTDSPKVPIGVAIAVVAVIVVVIAALALIFVLAWTKAH